MTEETGLPAVLIAGDSLEAINDYAEFKLPRIRILAPTNGTVLPENLRSTKRICVAAKVVNNAVE